MEQNNRIAPPIIIAHAGIQLELDAGMRTRVRDTRDGRSDLLGDFTDSQTAGEYADFRAGALTKSAVSDELGAGVAYRVTGRCRALEKELTVSAHDRFPGVLFIDTRFVNRGEEDISLTRWTGACCQVVSKEPEGGDLFWSFQGASYEARPDWILPLRDGFSQRNYLGMNSSDYGGGIPLTDLWRRDVGVAVGHCECAPKLVSLPVEVKDGTAAVSLCGETDVCLAPGESLCAPKIFIMLHGGDYFRALQTYRAIMESRGMHFPDVNPEAYEATWCAWGYERNFRVEQIYGALPKVKELGFKWVCLDDGWQHEEGDLALDRSKFPNGESDMREFVREIHARGFKIQLWWVPMACDPKSYFFAEHPDSIIRGCDGAPQEITWWNNYYLCPACDDVVDYTRQTVRKMLHDWDFDGLKIDGQHVNAAPLCHNPAHHHARPEDSYDAVPDFYKMIFEEAKRIKPEALIMFCPCGTCCSFFTMPYFDMPVASDPESSWQVRLRAKAYKALLGADIPYNADHLELSDGGRDFASAVGTGSVLNTKFTWPVGSGPISEDKPGATYDLDMADEAVSHKWLDIYREKMLPSGEYLGGLYDLGFDRPECHVIRKEGTMYYAFYAPSFDGTLQLRGLDGGAHQVHDYANGRKVALLKPGEQAVSLRFERYALLEVSRL